MSENINMLSAAIEAAIAEGKCSETPTLKAMAAVIGIQPNRVYSVAKTPKEGEVYDARVYNWDALEKFFSKRLNADEGETLEDFIDRAIEMDKDLKANDRRVTRGVPESERYITTAHGLIPKRKYAFEFGQRILMKKDKDTVYEVVLASDTHLVVAPEGTTEYKALANWTVNSQVIPPHRFEEALAARLEAAEDAEATTEGDAE